MKAQSFFKQKQKEKGSSSMTRKKLSLIVGILSMNLLLMSATAVTSAIAAISKSFPDEPISKVQMISSVAQFGQVIATLAFSWLAFHLTRKNLGLIAVAVVAVFGLLPAFYSSSLNLILASMVLIGFGLGIITNVYPILVQEYFDGEERASVLGWAVGVNNIGMMAFTAVGGVLGGSNWRNLFWVYGVSVIVFLLVFFLVPQDKSLDAEKAQANGGTAKAEKVSFWKTLKSLKRLIFVLLAITLAASFGMQIFLSNLSLVLAEFGRGTAYTGIVTAIGNVGGILTAFALKYLRKLTKQNTIAWGFVAFALSYVFIILSNNFILHIVGNMFSGMGIVMVNATIPYELSVLADKTHFPVAISMNTLVSSIAGTVAPIVIAAIGIGTGRPSFIAGIVLTLVVAALLFVTRFGSRVEKHGDTPEPAPKQSTPAAQ